MKKHKVHTHYTASTGSRRDVKKTPPSKEKLSLTEKLGFSDLAQNLKNSLVAWHRAGYPIVSQSEWGRRVAICRSCRYWKEFKQTQLATCQKCGCSSGKLLLKTSKCPLNPPKW